MTNLACHDDLTGFPVLRASVLVPGLACGHRLWDILDKGTTFLTKNVLFGIDAPADLRDVPELEPAKGTDVPLLLVKQDVDVVVGYGVELLAALETPVIGLLEFFKRKSDVKCAVK